MVKSAFVPLFFISLSVAAGGPAHGGETPAEGPFTNAACVACHQETTPDTVAAWRASSHSSTQPGADCLACHGNGHREALSRARRNDTCTTCHGGSKGSVVGSYITSKHGVIATIEDTNWDFSRPLADANYRAPTCPYCHLHEGEHDPARSMVSSRSAPLANPAGGDITAPARENMEEVCRDCHSPRYVATLIEGGERMMGIARLKVGEAAAVLKGEKTYRREDRERLSQRLETMQGVTLRDLWRGIAHQSPDYQWWYGQAALDGDLLRLKAMVSRIRRQRELGITSGEP